MSSQHYVSKFHLREFCDLDSIATPDPWLWVGNLADGSVKRRSPKNIGTRAGLFDGPGGFANSNATIESFLANEVEGPASRALRIAMLAGGRSHQAGGHMKETLVASMILTGALLAGGCATKKYVQQTTTPIQTKVDQVSDQANKQGTEIDTAKKDIERHEAGINAAKERAMSAEKAAGDAMNKATEAGNTATEARTMADKNGKEISSLRESLGNLDDYKLQAETVVLFGFNKDMLTPDAKEQLDQFVKEHANARRYFITVEGFTDKTGSKSYNDALSHRRADHVMAYLITQHDIPVYRVQMIGLGNEKPADTGRNRAARAKNRRVEIRLFSADRK